MAGPRRSKGAVEYLRILLATILFPLLWMKAFSLAKRHKDDDPRGTAKVAIAIVLGVVIAVVAVQAVVEFRESSIDGMYGKLQTRIASDIGEKEYQDQVAIIAARDAAIPKINENIAVQRAAGNDAKVASLESALGNATKERSDAVARKAQLEPMHAAFENVKPALAAHDDAAILAILGAPGAPRYTDGTGLDLNMMPAVERDLAIKDKAISDMDFFLRWFVFPSIAGMFFAPLAFALGSILGKAFVPSDTVGFKKYPGTAAGFFLLLGAFGVPSIPFAAWTFTDMEGRSLEGQIAL